MKFKSVMYFRMKRPTFVSTRNEIMMPFFSPTKVELTLEMLKTKLRFLLSKLVKKILSTRVIYYRVLSSEPLEEREKSLLTDRLGGKEAWSPTQFS